MSAWAARVTEPQGTAGARRMRAAVAFLALLAPAVAGAAAPDSTALDGRFVRRVVVDARSIFDPVPKRGATLYRLANRVHIVTRASTLRSAFTFREGGTWSEAKRAETERHLRALPFVVPDSVVATPRGADSVDVRVVTHDNWTTSPEFSIESGGGQRFGAFSLVERNLVGLGTSLSLSYRSDVNGISRVARIEDGELFGSHWRGRLSFGNNNGGSSRGALLSLPFWSDAAPLTATAGWTRDTYDAELYSGGRLASTIPVKNEFTDLIWGRGRLGANGVIVRMVASYEQRDRFLDAPRLEPGAPAAFAGPAEQIDIRRLNGELQVSRPRYVVVRAVEQMDRDEDVDLGPGGSIKLGFAPKAFGSSADEGYVRLAVHTAHDAGRAGFGLVSTSTRARLRPGVIEMLSEASGHWVNQPVRDVAVVVGFMGIGGYNMERDFQVTLGGISGLRAFPVHELTGSQAWRGNAELRWVSVRDWLQLVSVGGAVFWDGGRTWGPGAEDPNWHHDVGFGLRLSLPHSALNAVARFDVAWPTGPAHDGKRGPAYSFGSGQAF